MCESSDNDVLNASFRRLVSEIYAVGCAFVSAGLLGREVELLTGR